MNLTYKKILINVIYRWVQSNYRARPQKCNSKCQIHSRCLDIVTTNHYPVLVLHFITWNILIFTTRDFSYNYSAHLKFTASIPGNAKIIYKTCRRRPAKTFFIEHKPNSSPSRPVIVYTFQYEKSQQLPNQSHICTKSRDDIDSFRLKKKTQRTARRVPPTKTNL